MGGEVCYLCKHRAEIFVQHNKSMMLVACPACGQYLISHKATFNYRDEKLKDESLPEAYKSSAYVKRRNLLKEDTVMILAGNSRPTEPFQKTKEQMDLAFPNWSDSVNLAIHNLYLLSEGGNNSINLETKDYPILHCSSKKKSHMLAELRDEGFINGYTSTLPCEVILTRKGREYAEQWVAKKGVIRLQEIKKIRDQFLKFVYDDTKGDRYTTVDPDEIFKKLGLSLHEKVRIVDYLIDDGYLEQLTFDGISITHKGVKAVEEGMFVAPVTQPSFGPVTINNINSPHAQVGFQSIQSYVHNENQVSLPVQELLQFAVMLKEAVPALPISDDDKDTAESDLKIVERQLSQDSPDQEKLSPRWKNVIGSIGIDAFKQFVQSATPKVISWFQDAVFK